MDRVIFSGISPRLRNAVEGKRSLDAGFKEVAQTLISRAFCITSWHQTNWPFPKKCRRGIDDSAAASQVKAPVLIFRRGYDAAEAAGARCSRPPQ